MKIVVTGGSGRLARALARTGDHRVLALSHADLDVADPAAIARMFERVRPAAVINTAVRGNVDAVEAHPESAFAVNAIAPGLLADACAKAAAPLIHLSTDYVFGAPADRPWREDDSVSPINAYGRMKAEGERRVLVVGGRACIVRVAWLFGDGLDFIAGLLRAGADRPAVVADDQIGSPTPIMPLAARILELADAMIAGQAATPTILHLAGTPPVSRSDWVAAAFAALDLAGLPRPALRLAPMASFKSLAPRPHYSALDCSRAAALFGAPLDWRKETALAATFLGP